VLKVAKSEVERRSNHCWTGKQILGSRETMGKHHWILPSCADYSSHKEVGSAHERYRFVRIASTGEGMARLEKQSTKMD
jgi:hypothetical protein